MATMTGALESLRVHTCAYEGVFFSREGIFRSTFYSDSASYWHSLCHLTSRFLDLIMTPEGADLGVSLVPINPGIECKRM